jgi:hypothetical protein
MIITTCWILWIPVRAGDGLLDEQPIETSATTITMIASRPAEGGHIPSEGRRHNALT